MWTRTIYAASFATGLMLGTASAQEDLVTVDLSGLNAQMARNLEIEADEIPLTLQLPAAMAADVCGVDTASLSGSCAATDMMWATHYALPDIEGDPFSIADKDEADRATKGALLDAPGSITTPSAPHGP